MSKRKFINIKTLQLNNKLIKIESNGEIIKNFFKNSNKFEISKEPPKQQLNEYSDEDLEIVIDSLKIHDLRIQNIERTISEMLSQINLLNRLKREKFKFNFPISTNFDLMNMEDRLAEQDFYDLFVMVVGKIYPAKFSRFEKLGCIFSSKLLSSYDYDYRMWIGNDKILQKKPLKTLKVIDGLFDALVSIGKFSSREEYDMELKKYMENLKG